MFDKLEALEEKFSTLAEKISDPEIIADQETWRKLCKEHSDLSPIIDKYKEYKQAKQIIADDKEMLAEGVEKTSAEVKDIVENPKKLKFITDIEASMLAQVYNNGEGDAVLINSNYALDAGLNPVEDAIALENSDSPYVNVIAVNSGNENNEAIQKLVEVLRSEEIQQFILEEYNGSVVPVVE